MARPNQYEVYPSNFTDEQRRLTRFEDEWNVLPVDAAKLLGVPFRTYSRWRQGTRHISRCHDLFIRTLLMLTPEQRQSYVLMSKKSPLPRWRSCKNANRFKAAPIERQATTVSNADVYRFIRGAHDVARLLPQDHADEVHDPLPPESGPSVAR